MNLHSKLEIVSGRHPLDIIKEEWLELGEIMEKKRFFHMREYYISYIENLENNPDSIIFCVLRDDDGVAGIFPFRKVVWHFGPIFLNVLESIQHYNTQLVEFQYDFILRNKENSGIFLKRLLENLNKTAGMSWDIISIRNVLEDSYAASAMKEDLCIRKQCQFSQKCYYIVTDSYDRILKGTSSNFRRSLKRSRKNLSELGASSVQSVSDLPKMDECYTSFLNLEGSGWKGQNGTSIIQHDDAVNFYRSLLHCFSNKGCCEIQELKLNDQTIASFFCIRDNNAFYLPKISYSEEYDEASPGKQLFNYFIKRCCEMQDINELVFLSNAHYLEHWRPKYYNKLNYFLFNNTFEANIGYTFKLARDLVRPYDNYIMQYIKLIKVKPIRKFLSILR